MRYSLILAFLLTGCIRRPSSPSLYVHVGTGVRAERAVEFTVPVTLGMPFTVTNSSGSRIEGTVSRAVEAYEVVVSAPTGFYRGLIALESPVGAKGGAVVAGRIWPTWFMLSTNRNGRFPP